MSGRNVIAAFVTTKDKQRGFNVVKLSPNSSNGLRTSSQVDCAKLATFDISLIRGGIGRLSQSEKTQIQKALRYVFAI